MDFQFRDMFSSIFGKQGKQQESQPITVASYKTLNDYIPQFSAYSGNLYDIDIVRSCIDAIARNTAKLKAKHIRRVNGEIINTDSEIEWMLSMRPNEYMSAYDFIYKIISQLYTTNNAFVFIRVEMGKITGFYPISYSTIEFVEYQGEIYAKFLFKSGKKMAVPYSELIHLRRHFNTDDLFGSNARTPFKPTLDTLNTMSQGTTNAIKGSARLRGWLKTTQSVRPEDLKKMKDDFVADYLNIDNDGGIAALDAKYDFVPADLKPVTASNEQMGGVRQQVLQWFGLNEKIIQASYNENEFNAFYSSVIEPLAIQMSQEFTQKCFTAREHGHGNEIVFSANRLNFASQQTKTLMIKELGSLGILTINEAREIIELEPVEDGDKRLITLNVVSADKQNQYQLGEKPVQTDKEEGGDEQGDQV